MADSTELLALEERFWKGDASFYDEHLAPDALMVFAGPGGVMSRDQIVESIRDSARWRDVRLSEVSTLQLAPGAVLVTYHASAARDGADTRYTARATSVYISNGSAWRLTFHQQTPLEAS